MGCTHEKLAKKHILLLLLSFGCHHVLPTGTSKGTFKLETKFHLGTVENCLLRQFRTDCLQIISGLVGRPCVPSVYWNMWRNVSFHQWVQILFLVVGSMSQRSDGEKLTLMSHSWSSVFCLFCRILHDLKTSNPINVRMSPTLQSVIQSIKPLWLSFWRADVRQLFGSWEESELFAFWNVMFSSLWLVASSAEFASCCNSQSGVQTQFGCSECGNCVWACVCVCARYWVFSKTEFKWEVKGVWVYVMKSVIIPPPFFKTLLLQLKSLCGPGRQCGVWWWWRWRATADCVFVCDFLYITGFEMLRDWRAYRVGGYLASSAASCWVSELAKQRSGEASGEKCNRIKAAPVFPCDKKAPKL